MTAEWKQTRLKYVADCNVRTLPESTSAKQEFAYVDVSNVTQGQMAIPAELVRFGDAPSRARRLAEPGDSIVSTVRTYLRAVATVPESAADLVFSTAFAVLSPNAAVDGRFLAWYLQGDEFVSRVEGRSVGVSYPAITSTQLMTLDLRLPPLRVQRAIADYLDRETARIDTLIEEERQLIALLSERRQAAIDHAYETFGSRVQLRRHISFLTSGSRGWGDYYADSGDRFLRIGNLPRGGLRPRGEVQYVDLPPHVTEGSRTSLKKGDLLFSITAFLGSVAVVDEDWAGGFVSQHVALCRLSPTIESAFAGWFCLSSEGQDQLRVGAAGGTKQQLALDDVKELRVPSAGLEEQRVVIEQVTKAVQEIDVLEEAAAGLIALAQERRAALITAAVTGQIDVGSAA